MAHSRAGAVFAVFAALAACHSSPEQLDGQDRMTHTVTIELDLEQSLEQTERGNPPAITTTPDPIRVRRGDTVTWSFADGPWMVHPTPLSPFDRVVLQGQGGEEVSVTVREDAMLGVYKSIIAVYAEGEVFVADPHFVVGR